MAVFTKVNPTVTTTNYEVVGRDINFFTVNYGADVSGSAEPNGVQDLVLRAIMNQHTIIAAGPLFSSNQQQTFAIEGPLVTPNDVTLVSSTYLQDLINSYGIVDSINTANITVTATKLAIASSAAV